MTPALIVCIGNSLVGDDAVGCHIYDKLAAEPLPENIRLVQLGVGGIQLLDILDGEPLVVVVDAVSFGDVPGKIHVIDWEEIEPAEGMPVVSHDIGLVEVMQIARKLYPKKAPKRTVLVGIEGACFNELGVPLSEKVAAALERATQTVLATVGVNAWRNS